MGFGGLNASFPFPHRERECLADRSVVLQLCFVSDDVALKHRHRN